MVTVQDQFREFSKYYPVIATTYNFDFQTIRDMIAPHRGIREQSIVITDRGCFNETSQNQSFADQGLSYFVYPAYNVEKSFHSKVVIGLEEGILKILVGSHNLTESGVRHNLEITSLSKIPLCTIYEEQLQEISAFMEGLSNCIELDSIPKKTMANIVNGSRDLHQENAKLKQQQSFFFLHSFKESILEQVLERIPTISHVTICAPTLSEEKQFIEDAIHALGDRATFLIDPKAFSLSDNAKETYQKYSLKFLKIRDNRCLHAKLFVFHTKNGDWTLFGSPNFTRPALWKSAEKGGNVEAAILLPPSNVWHWKELFQDTVRTSKIQWSELSSVGLDNQQVLKNSAVVESWGYETSNNEGIILAPGLPEGTNVIVRLLGLGRDCPASVANGMVRFDIPSIWIDETRYEILDMSGTIIASGFLNRTGAIIRDFSHLSMDDVAKVDLWFYMQKLHSYKSRSYYSGALSDLLDTPLNPKTWQLGPSASAWTPIMKKEFSIHPKKIYDKAISAFEEAQYEYRKCTRTSKSAKLKQLLFTMDLLIEGTFYTFFLPEGGTNYLVKLPKCLSVFLRLPYDNPPWDKWDANSWRERYYSKLNDDLLRQWETYGGRFQLDVSLLINFWLYHHSKTLRYRASSRQPLDITIITNRYYQAVEAIKMLTNPRERGAAFERVWDSRLGYLKSSGDIRVPSGLTDLEEYLNRSYQDALVNL